MSTATKKSRSNGKANGRRKQLKKSLGSPAAKARSTTNDYENQRFGVFLECADDAIPPVLLRPCPNKFEAYGWREHWKVDDFIFPKMTVRPIDANGQPTAEELASDRVAH